MATQPHQNAGPTAIKDPAEWVTGDEPMTGAQASYVHTLARAAGENVADDMTKAEASEKIEELQEKTGRQPAAKARKPAAKKTTARKKG
ncbi:MAG: DUF3072 domain-containing protein [Gemmataceae bacterium]|nr:DUF3072 domain-containing protein [Gemmataceae bacterium]